MTRQRKTITSDNNTQRQRALAAARQRKRNKAWRDALERAGWSESEYKTAVIKCEIELPTKPQGE